MDRICNASRVWSLMSGVPSRPAKASKPAMINSILEFSLRQCAVVLLATLALLGAGLWSASHLPIDAVPDITGVQVQINTEVPALAAEESEKLVTQLIETGIAGVPGLDEMWSLT